MDRPPALPARSARPGQLASLADLAAIPEEEVWLASQKSARTRRAYKLDVAHFMRTLGITTPEQLRQVDHRAVIAWERIMREEEGAAAPPCAAAWRRCRACSSTWCGTGPPAGTRWRTWRGRASTARKAAPPPSRRRRPASCSTRRRRHRGRPARPRHPLGGLAGGATPGGDRRPDGGRPAPEPGLRRAARDPQGRPARRPGDQPAGGAAHPRLPGAGRAWGEHDGPLFRPLRGNAKAHDPAGQLDPDAIDRMVRKYAAAIGLARGYSAHSMRATFITTALENGAQLEDVQKAAGHRDPSTTKLYDRRGYNPEKAASFFATY